MSLVMGAAGNETGADVGAQAFHCLLKSTKGRLHQTALDPQRTNNSKLNDTLLNMGRYYNTTIRHYWDMLVK